ncbi:MAG: RHS repeat-associated core domain-containing protein, partial [Planctomycetaceae bacterium]
DPLGRETTRTYDDLNRVSSVTDATGGITSFGYDATSNRTSITDPLSQTTTFAWDGVGQMIGETDPLGSSRSYQYDPVGNLAQTTDKNGRVRQFDYDALNRRISEFWLHASSIVESFTYTYDATSNLASAADSGSSYTMTWDALDRMTQIAGGSTVIPALTLTYGVDAVGNIISRTDQTGVSVASTFDARNQLSSRTWSGGGIADARIDYTYDARGGRSLVERFSDVTGTNRIGSTSYQFDEVGNLTNLSHLNSVDAVFSDFDFAWNLGGELTSRTEDGQITTYVHDDTGQLISADHANLTDEAYSYDANGNRIAVGLNIGPNNQVLADATYSYLYDAEGNMTRRTITATGEYTQYQYDYRNQMVDATDYTSGGSVLQEVSFGYDVFDRRITKTVDADGAGPLAPVTIHTAYDGQHAWADLDAAGNVVARYLFGTSIDEVAARWMPTDGTAWYVTDKLGSVRYLLDNAGTILNSLVYDSFGNIISQSNPSAFDRFTFTGREFDAELGLYYYRARSYNPELGRFISQDPIAFAAGDANLYRYVSNSPLTFVDPSGNEGGAIFDGFAAQRSAAVAGATAGAVWGFACGFAEAFTTVASNGGTLEDAAVAGLKQGIYYGTIGAGLGAALAISSPVYQAFAAGIFFSLGAAMQVYADEPLMTKIVRTPCLFLVAHGGVNAARQVELPGPLRNFLFEQYGSVPHPEGPFIDSSGTPAQSNEIPTGEPSTGPNATAQNAATAFDYYTKQAGYPARRATDHIEGIDLNSPVTPMTIPPGTALQQYVGPKGTGNYFSPVGSTPLQVGIPELGQTPTLFESVGNVPALQSNSRPDFIYPPGRVVPGSGAGGATQFFVPDNTLLVPIQ